MDKNVVNCKKREFVPGRMLRATVKVVNETGVMIKMPGARGAGVISSRCWGAGVEREEALAAIRPGDEFNVVVCSYDARTMTLSLVLAGCERLMPPTGQKANVVRQIAPQQKVVGPRKPDFVPIAAGATFLWDAANLLGMAGVENAARTFDAISGSLSEQGYKTMFFIERRCLTWALHNQRSTDEAAELDAFSRRSDVVVVGDGGNGTGEADCAILQMAEALPGSICVTRDRYEDYAHTYPGIVGTNRIRSFSVAKIEGKTMVLVNGIAHAIVVPPAISQHADVTDAPAKAEIADGRHGLLAVAEECLRRGDEQAAVRIYEKVAKRDPTAYRALAEMYRGGTAVSADAKKAVRYERLARASEKRCRERSLRERRMRAESIRGDRHFADHFAARRRKALNLDIFAENHKMICEYGRIRRGNAVHNRRVA